MQIALIRNYLAVWVLFLKRQNSRIGHQITVEEDILKMLDTRDSR